MEFEEACSEIYYILEHMNPRDKAKVPDSTIQFFKNNKSVLYKVKLDVTKPLDKQELKYETKAFIEILNAKYFLNETEKNNFSKYFFKEEIEKTDSKELTIIKEPTRVWVWLKKIIKRIFKR